MNPYMMYPPPGPAASFMNPQLLPYNFPFMHSMGVPPTDMSKQQFVNPQPNHLLYRSAETPLQASSFSQNDSFTHMSQTGLPVRTCRIRQAATEPAPQIPRRSADSSDEDSCSDTETASSRQSSDSDSDAAAPSSDSDDSSDSDYKHTRRKPRRSKGAGLVGRPASAWRSRGGHSGIGKFKYNDESDLDDLVRSTTKRKPGRWNKRKGFGVVPDNGLKNGVEGIYEDDGDHESDSSYSDGTSPKRRKRERATSPGTYRRISSRHPGKTQRVNYAQLGQSFESEEEIPDSNAVLEELAQQHDVPTGPSVDRVLGYRNVDSRKC